MLNATATKVLVNNSKGQKTISGVEFMYNGQLHRVNVLKEAVLSAGAVNSPQLLLLSGIGPKEELEKVGIQQVHELPGVGKNLHNHVTFYLTFLLRKLRAVNDLDWATALDYILYRKGPMSSTGMSQLTARINSRYADPSGSFPDLQIFFAGYLAHCAKSGEVNAPLDSTNPDLPRELTMSPVVLHPKSRGYVTLKSKNPLDPPLMYANYLTDPEDVATLIEGIRVTQRLANTTVLRSKHGIELVKEEYDDCIKKHTYDSDEFWECAVRHSTGPENHQAGSCKMGPSYDRMAVVNPKLQVYGISGLRVMDASVMPSVVSGNTHATIVMIAERGVDFIKKDWAAKTLSNRAAFAGSAPGFSTTYDYQTTPTTVTKQQRVGTSSRGGFTGGSSYPASGHGNVHSSNVHKYNSGAYYPEYHHPADGTYRGGYDHGNYRHSRTFHEMHPEMPNPFENDDYGYANYRDSEHGGDRYDYGNQGVKTRH